MKRRTLAMLLLLVCAAGAHAEPVKAVRGLANHVDVDYAPRLRARADQSPASQVMVRVSPAPSGGGQRIEFIGTVVGTFDLRNYLERDDGKPLTDLAELSVSVASKLPADAGTDLYSSEQSWFNWRAHYRTLLWGAVGLWVTTPLAYWFVRRMRRTAPVAPPAPAAPPPTIEEQLLDAIRTAGMGGSGEVSVADRARLELLLFRYFGERMSVPTSMDGDPAAMYQAVRRHMDTRELVGALERWLHARGGGEMARQEAAAALEHLRTSRLAGSPVEVHA